MENNVNLKEFYTIGQISEELGFHIQTLRVYIKEGTLRASKVGTRYIVQREDIKKWLNDNEYKPNNELKKHTIRKIKTK